MSHRVLLWILAALSLMVGAAKTGAQVQNFTPVTDAVLANPLPEDWLSWRRTLDGQGFSPLAQINRDNVARLQLVWSWGMEAGVSATTPIVYKGVMYIVNPGSVVQALEATTGEMIWEYRPEAPRGGQMRSMAIYEDLIILNAPGPRVMALDAKTGKLRWDTPVAGQETGFGFSNGPLVADGVVVSGMSSCGRFQKESCSLVGLEARTGNLLWRTPTIAQPGEFGDDTWGGAEPLFRAGGEAWMTGSYDPVTKLVYWGTGQAKPWTRAARRTAGGVELYTNSTLALDPKTGKIAWYFQHIPAESHDQDEVFERILIDYDGKQSVFSMGKLGILWELDRKTGKYLRSHDLGYQNLVDLDSVTGKVTYRPGMLQLLEEPFYQCPSFSGIRGLRAMSYDPGLGALFVPMLLSCQTSKFPDVPRREGSGGNGNVYDRTNHFHPASPEHLGQFLALDIRTGKPLWTVKRRTPSHTAPLATAGGIVFFGDWDRYFFAYDAKTGAQLWQTRLPIMTNGFPVTYSVNGRQYVAVLAGQAGAGITWSTILPTTLLPEKKNPRAGNAIFVFALPDQK